MTDLREQLADVIEVAIDNAHDMDVTHRDYASAAADAIIAALPGMVPPLVWEQSEGNFAGQTVWSYDSKQTQWIVQNGNEDHFVLCESLTIDFAPCSPVTGVYEALEAAKAAAQAHHVATIMQAFGVQGGEA